MNLFELSAFTSIGLGALAGANASRHGVLPALFGGGLGVVVALVMYAAAFAPVMLLMHFTSKHAGPSTRRNFAVSVLMFVGALGAPILALIASPWVVRVTGDWLWA